MDRYLDSTCAKTGKTVGYLWSMECFEPIPLPQPVAETPLHFDNIAKQITIMEEKKLTKVCKKCGRELHIDRFRPNPKCKDGHIDTCYECMSMNMPPLKTETNKEDVFPATQDKFDRLQEYTPQELVDHLRFLGWTVTCTKLVEL